MEISNQTVLITGGASGIGFELAKQLDQLNNTIIITGRNQGKLDQARQKLPKIHTFRSDVAQVSDISELFQKVTQQFPDLNILVNNAGIMRTLNLHHAQTQLDDLTREIETNLMGPIRMAKQFLPHLKKQKSAAIMNISSGLAFVPLATSPVYCATKAGLHSFTCSLRIQLKNTQIKVFELAPPATETELLGDFMSEDMKNITVMKVEPMVAAAIDGMKNDRLEICPGQSNQLRWMSRIAPQFIVNQLGKPVDRMLREDNPEKGRR